MLRSLRARDQSWSCAFRCRCQVSKFEGADKPFLQSSEFKLGMSSDSMIKCAAISPNLSSEFQVCKSSRFAKILICLRSETPIKPSSTLGISRFAQQALRAFER